MEQAATHNEQVRFHSEFTCEMADTLPRLARFADSHAGLKHLTYCSTTQNLIFAYKFSFFNLNINEQNL